MQKPAVAQKPVSAGAWTDSFIDARGFAGGFDQRRSNTTLGGRAVYSGRIVFTNLDRAIVQQVLDAMPSSDLTLAQNISATPNRHPVVLLIGDQRHTSLVEPPGSIIPIGDDYRELILLIPFVQKSGSSKWHNYVVHIFLDDLAAMWIGNQYYGLHKEMAVLVDGAQGYEVSRGSQPVFHAVFAASQPWIPDASAEAQLANYQGTKEILAMPVLGTITTLPSQPYVCTYFELDYSNAEVRPITSQHEFLEEFEAGMGAWKSGGPYANVPDGAFEIRNVDWRNAFPPLACSF